MTHPLLIDHYTAHKRTLFLLSCTIFFSFVIPLSVLDAFFVVSVVPVNDVETQSANPKYTQMILNCAIFHLTQLFV